MDKNQIVPERPLRITAFDKTTGVAKFMLTEVSDFQQSTTVNEDTTIRSADGSTIGQLENGKEGSLSGEATFVNFGLMAAQNGTEVKQGTASEKIDIIKYEEVTVKKGTKIGTLEQAAKGTAGEEIGNIYIMNDDGGMGAKYTQAATAGDGTFKYTPSSRQIELAANVTEDTTFIVYYTYESDKSILIENNANEYGGVYRVVADILCHDICNFDNVIVATVDAPNAKLSSAYDITWGTEQTHPFSFTLGADYCSKSKKLYDTYINLDEPVESDGE